MAQASDTSLYDLLEVHARASTEEIEASYQRIVSVLRPTSLAMYSILEEGDSDPVRTQLDEARRTLVDPDRRAAYDRQHGERRERTPREHAQASAPAAAHDGSMPFAPSSTLDFNAEVAVPRVVAEPSVASPAHSVMAPAGGGASAAVSAPTTPAAANDSEAKLVAPSPAERVAASVRRSGARKRLQASIVATPDTEFSGALLRRLRESCNATLEDVADLTKISKRYLHALEETDFETLPAAVYVRGFVSEYARALGLDPKVVSRSYMALYQRPRSGGAS